MSPEQRLGFTNQVTRNELLRARNARIERFSMKVILHHHVTAVLGQHPELWGIFGKTVLMSLGDAKTERLDADFMAAHGHPYAPMYFIVSTDGKFLGIVGRGFRPWLMRLFGHHERVIEALKRLGIGHAAYIVAIHREEEDEGYDKPIPKYMVIHSVPEGQTMTTHVAHLQPRIDEIISQNH